VLADRGIVVLLETNWPGDPLGYLEHLGGRSGRLPPAVDRLVRLGLPRPSSIGPEQLTALFPPPEWDVLASGPVDIGVVRAPGAGADVTVPGFHAVLSRAAHPAT
jgi:hypothetical protein